MRYLLILTLITLISCNKNSKEVDLEITRVSSDKEDVRKAIMNNYDFFNENDLSDSTTFNRFKAFYFESFVLGPSEGKPLSDKETILEEWRELFKENKGNFNLTIDRIEVSGDLAYVLYHYDEKLTNIQSGDIYFEVVQSAVAVLRKNSEGNWLFEFIRWN